MESIKKYKLSFTQVPNVVLKDRRLSLKAKGLYAYLFSKPDGWQFNSKSILKEIKEGRDAFYGAMAELIKCGYIHRHQQNAAGVFGHCVYKFVDPTAPCTEKPCTENPYTENPHTGTYKTNTEITNTEINNINNIINNNKTHARTREGKIYITPEFEIDFQDPTFGDICSAKGELSKAVERWIITNKLGKVVDKTFVRRQIINFASRQNKIQDLMKSNKTTQKGE